MTALRNVVIIALLALVVAAAPAGGNVVQALLAAFTLILLAVIAISVQQAYRRYRFDYQTLPDWPRTVLLGAVGAIALMIAGADEMFATGIGTLVWIAIIAGAIGAIVAVVRQARAL